MGGNAREMWTTITSAVTAVRRPRTLANQCGEEKRLDSNLPQPVPLPQPTSTTMARLKFGDHQWND